MRLFVVACCYSVTPEKMHRLLLDLLSGYRLCVKGFLVSQNVMHKYSINDEWEVLPCTNYCNDFSAYITGAKVSILESDSSSLTLFLNDTLFAKHAASTTIKSVMRQMKLLQQIELPAITGKVDRYTTICHRNPWSRLDFYVSTYCFMLNRLGLNVLENLLKDIDDDGFADVYELSKTVFKDIYISTFAEFVKANFVYQDSPYAWYRLKQTKFLPDQVRSKARAVYLEHKLSGEIGLNGCILPINAGPRWTTIIFFAELFNRVCKYFIDRISLANIFVHK